MGELVKEQHLMEPYLSAAMAVTNQPCSRSRGWRPGYGRTAVFFEVTLRVGHRESVAVLVTTGPVRRQR